jgi:hypothetical protein
VVRSDTYIFYCPALSKCDTLLLAHRYLLAMLYRTEMSIKLFKKRNFTGQPAFREGEIAVRVCIGC